MASFLATAGPAKSLNGIAHILLGLLDSPDGSLPQQVNPVKTRLWQALCLTVSRFLKLDDPDYPGAPRTVDLSQIYDHVLLSPIEPIARGLRAIKSNDTPFPIIALHQPHFEPLPIDQSAEQAARQRHQELLGGKGVFIDA